MTMCTVWSIDVLLVLSSSILLVGLAQPKMEDILVYTFLMQYMCVLMCYLLHRILCVVVLCILTLCVIFNLSIFMYVN